MSKNSCHECRWSASAARVFDPPQEGLVCVYPFPEGPNYALVDPAYAGLCSFFAVRISEEKGAPPKDDTDPQDGGPVRLRGTGRPRIVPNGNRAKGGLGEKIKLARENKGWSQARLAALIGTRQATVADWETGKALPRRRAIILLERLLGPLKTWP